MPVARFQAKFAQTDIDSDSGIIRGVKVMQNGALARFAGEDGKPKQVTISPAHIDALLAHAGNRAIPSHLSHDWFGAKEDAIHSRIGALKNFSKDSVGNLIADLHLAPGEYRDTALWNASEAPENMMLSAVFSYGKDDAKCLPLDFQACDIVAQGAATTALFSENQKPPMDITELLAALDDPAVKAAVKAILKSHTGPDEAATEEAATATETEAGVMEEDKKPEDDTKPALMRSAVRIHRATLRQAKAIIAAERTAILAEAALKGEASATALLGKGKFVQQSEVKGEDEYESLLIAKLAANPSLSRARAKFNLNTERPDLYAKKQEQLYNITTK